MSQPLPVPPVVDQREAERVPAATRVERPRTERAPAGARALNTLSLTAIAVAFGLAASAATPSILRATGFGEASTIAAPRVIELPAPPRPLIVAPHPSFVEEDDDDPRTELERLFPNAPWPGRPPPSMSPQDDDRDPGRIEAGAQFRYGTAIHSFQLLQQPGDLKNATGFVKAQELVKIIKEQDGWVLVLRGGDDLSSQPTQPSIGWAKKSEIAIR